MELPRRSLLSISIVFSWFATVFATTDYFLSPPLPGPLDDFSNNPVYTVGSKIVLWWQTDYPTINLVLWQVAPKLATSSNSYPSQTLFEGHAPITSLEWAVDVSRFGTFGGDVYFFSVYNSAMTNTSFTCHYFNVSTTGATTTQKVVTALPPSLSAVTATVTPALAFVSGTIVPYSVPATPTASSSSTKKSTPTNTHSSTPHPGPQGLSSGATIGIGVGVGVGVAGILVGAALVWYMHRCSKKRREELPSQPSEHQMEYYGGPPNPGQEYAYHHAPVAPEARELDGTRAPSELPDADARKPLELPGSGNGR